MTPAAFIRRARRLGFSDREARDLSSVRSLPGACEAFQGRLQARRRELRRRMAALEAQDMELTLLLVACWRQQDSRGCRVRWNLDSRGSRSPGLQPGSDAL